MPYAISGGIAVINVVAKAVFQGLASFEKYGLFSKEASSRIIKIFAVTFINTGLILLISNYKMDLTIVPVVGEYLSGKYDDLGPMWFLNVGSNIIL